MKVCVVARAVVHAVPRTIAFAQSVDDVHFIDVAGRADGEELRAHDIHYYRPHEHGLSGIPFWNLQKLFQTIEPDVIVCHFCSGTHFFHAVAYGRAPVAGIVMGSDVLYESGNKSISGLRRLLVRMGLRSLFYISAKSDYLLRRCRAYGATCPIAVNYWGADLRHFRPLDRNQVRSKLGLPDDRVIILSPRKISAIYNIDLIIDAMSEVVRHEPAALLVILGDAVPKYRQGLEKQIEEAGIGDNVKIIGEIGHDEVPDYCNASDIVVSVSSTEGFPNSVLEVMCCRRPVIVGRIPQILEVLENNVDCRMVDINGSDIAASIVELIRRPDYAAWLAESGYRKACRIADIRANGKVFDADMRQHLAEHKKGSRMKLIFYRFFLIVYVIYKGVFRRLA